MGCGVCLGSTLLATVVDLARGVSLRRGVYELFLLGCCVHCLRYVVCGVGELLCVDVVM